MSGSAIFFHVISQAARFSGGEKVTEHKACFFISLQPLSETFLILRILEQNMMNVPSFSCEGPVIFPDFNGT